MKQEKKTHCCENYPNCSTIVEENSFNRTLTKEEITDLYNKGVAVEKKGWEEKFDEIGFGNQAIIVGFKRVELKKFIRSTLAEERELIVKEIEIMKEEGRVGEGWTMDGVRMVERFNKLINIIKNNK